MNRQNFTGPEALSAVTWEVVLSALWSECRLTASTFPSEFIPCIFASGVKEDRISTVEMLLSTLQTKVRVWYPRLSFVSSCFTGLGGQPQLPGWPQGGGSCFLGRAVLGRQP